MAIVVVRLTDHRKRKWRLRNIDTLGMALTCSEFIRHGLSVTVHSLWLRISSIDCIIMHNLIDPENYKVKKSIACLCDEFIVIKDDVSAMTYHPAY